MEPLILVHINGLSCESDLVITMPVHSVDCARERENIVPLARVAAQLPGNRAVESAVENDSLRFSIVALAFHDKAGAKSGKGASGPDTGAHEKASRKTDRAQGVSGGCCNPV